MLIGIILVSVATSLPELMTSLLAAVQGIPELALGNAVGSIAINEGVALGLAAAVSATPLLADKSTFRICAPVLLLVIVTAFVMTMDSVLSSGEGGLLFFMYIAYSAIWYFYIRKQRAEDAAEARKAPEDLVEIEQRVIAMKLSKILLLFLGGLGGVMLGSQFLVTGAEKIALLFGMPPVVVGLTITAIGTSTPEIATCLASALKKESAIGVGNILGSDIFNICCVAGLSAVANPLETTPRVVWFMFPAVLVIVSATLLMLRFRYNLSRMNGVVLLFLYSVYLVLLLLMQYSGPDQVIAG
jgi:cation:H+ antiporter